MKCTTPLESNWPVVKGLDKLDLSQQKVITINSQICLLGKTTLHLWSSSLMDVQIIHENMNLINLEVEWDHMECKRYLLRLQWHIKVVWKKQFFFYINLFPHRNQKENKETKCRIYAISKCTKNPSTNEKWLLENHLQNGITWLVISTKMPLEKKNLLWVESIWTYTHLYVTVTLYGVHEIIDFNLQSLK